MPGYTHLQVAMPSSFGMWLSAYAEALADDMLLLDAAYKLVNTNPLGSGAGYGSSVPLDRRMTTRLLGFDDLAYNSIYAQMQRGKTERTVLTAIAAVAATLGRLAQDVCLYSCANFGFVKLPDAFTTGSSIMPHKKNPDIFELIRAKCNRLQALPTEVTLIMTNLPSGYFRDMQLTKEIYIPAFKEIGDALRMAGEGIERMSIDRGGCQRRRGARRAFPRRLSRGGHAGAERHVRARRPRVAPHARGQHRQPVPRRHTRQIRASRVRLRPCAESRGGVDEVAA